MGKFIEVDKIPFELHKGWDLFIAYKSDIDNIPPANVEEIKHGYWYGVTKNQEEVRGQCSECRKLGVLRTSRNSLGIWNIDMPRCPNCGAIMDGKTNYL